jgi:hypothetical protein
VTGSISQSGDAADNSIEILMSVITAGVPTFRAVVVKTVVTHTVTYFVID